MARAGKFCRAVGIGGDFEGSRTGNERLSSIVIYGDDVGAFGGVADQADAVLVCGVLVERNRQDGDQQRAEAQ